MGEIVEQSMSGATGVVLAGGQSARMGQSKAALPIGGEPLLRRVVRRLGAAFADVLVIGLPELAVLAPDARVLPDQHPGLGPLAGLEAALAAITTPRAFVVACDMPFIAPALARAMAASAAMLPDVDVVALRSSHGVEHLHAVYHVSCLPRIRAQLDAGDRSLRALLAGLRVHAFSPEDAARYDPTGLSAFNANTPEEWARALALAAVESAPLDVQ